MKRDPGNEPRWRNQQGFFEIWFLVVFIPGTKRALWLRYTLFSPAPGQPGTSRATVWAAAFNACAEEPKLALKRILPIDAYVAQSGEAFGIRIDDAEFSNGVCRGHIENNGHSINWDLHFDPSVERNDRSSIIMDHRLPLPTHVIHAYEGTTFRGNYSIDGTTYTLNDAPGLQKHIWGDKRVEELFWLYCSQFREDPSARIEVTSVRASRTLIGNIPFPALTPISFENDAGVQDFFAAWYLVRNVVKLVGPGKLELRASSLFRAIEVDADCDLRTLVGYVYRDPAGMNLYVAQSDIASCEVRLLERSNPFASFKTVRTLKSDEGAAIEFHLPEPLPDVRYIGWDETHLTQDTQSLS